MSSLPEPTTATRSVCSPIRSTPTFPYVLYTVRPGDTLGQIADTYNTTVDNILLNNVEVDEGGWIPVGQQVLVPFGTGILYKIGQGETLSAIIDDYLKRHH